VAEHRYPERAVASSPGPPHHRRPAGTSRAALRRVARYGDGWLGLWVSPARYATATVLFAKHAADAGRDVPAWQHGMHVWCGLGASPGAARDRLSETMEGFYNVPFGKFEKYTPYGTAGQIAESLRPYVEAGCRSFNLIPVADSKQAAIDGAAEVRALLGAQLT
jgi:alkanesulfonate monooxygenase SsuD/methylene tetrahydromethanopterin reductase-like flavin-dependent oxidoreductase (luciferase family)